MAEQQGRTIENIIFSSCVRYEQLKYLVYNTFSNSSIAQATEVNIFVDLYSVLKTIFSEHGHTDLSHGNYSDLTVCLVNLCAHYRTFFRGLGVKTNFYLIYSLNICDLNKKFYPEYNAKFEPKTEISAFKNLVQSNFAILDLIVPYLPDIYFIRGIENYESSIMISYLINKLNDGLPNIILSSDLYSIQLCCKHPYTSFLLPRKYHGDDISMMLPINEKDTFRDSFWWIVSTVRGINREKFGNLSPINFPLISAINRFPERNMNALTNIDSVCNFISSIVGDEDIKITESQLISIQNSKINIGPAIQRYKALDIDFIYPYYCNTPEAMSIKLENLQDTTGQLQKINAKYFANNPMKLEFL